MFFTGKDHETNLLEIRTVLHQVHPASMMISSHMDTSLGARQHLFPYVHPVRALHHPSRERTSCMLCHW